MTAQTTHTPLHPAGHRLQPAAVLCTDPLTSAAHPAGSRHDRRRRAAPWQAPCPRQTLRLRSPQGRRLLLAQLQRLQGLHSAVGGALEVLQERLARAP